MAEAKSAPKVSVDKKDIEENKIIAVLAYLGILFLVPLLAAPKSKYAKFHANQGCVLFIVEVAFTIVWIIPILGWIVGFVGGIATLVLAVMGILNAYNGKMAKLPVIGDYVVLK